MANLLFQAEETSKQSVVVEARYTTLLFQLQRRLSMFCAHYFLTHPLSEGRSSFATRGPSPRVICLLGESGLQPWGIAAAAAATSSALSRRPLKMKMKIKAVENEKDKQNDKEKCRTSAKLEAKHAK